MKKLTHILMALFLLVFSVLTASADHTGTAEPGSEETSEVSEEMPEAAETSPKEIDEVIAEDTDTSETVTEQTIEVSAEGVDASFAGELPENAEITMTPVETGEQTIHAFDITINDGWEPENPVVVSMSSQEIAQAIEEECFIYVIHTLDDGTDELVAAETAGDALIFTAESFSTYAVVTEIDEKVYQVPAENIEENKGYYIYSLVSNNTADIRYLLNDTYTSASPNGLKKTVSIDEADLFYFEAGENEGEYYMYTYEGDVKYYLYFEYLDNSNGHLKLSQTKVTPMTVTVSSADNGQYYISGYDYDTSGTKRTWYINQHANTNGARFAGWHQANNGSKLSLISLDPEALYDPLNLDGKEYVIVNSQRNNYAMTAEAYGTSGLKGVYVTQETIDGTPSFVTQNEEDVLTLWKFEAQENGSYHISTLVDGITKYMHLTDITSGNAGALILSDEPQDITVGADGETVFFCNPSGTQDGYIDVFNVNDDSRRQFSVYIQSGNKSNQRFVLGIPADGAIIYRYPEYDGADAAEINDEGTENNLPEYQIVIPADGDTIAEPSQTTYVSENSEYCWNYEFAGWTDGTNTYLPGYPLPEYTGTLTLYAKWTYKGRTEHPKTVVYDAALPANAVSPLPAVNGGITSEEVSGARVYSYPVRGLTNDKCLVTDAAAAYEFMGWENENGDLIDANTVIDLNETAEGVSVYDPDGDHVVHLTARWSGQYENANSSNYRNRVVKFYVSIRTLSSDIFDLKPAISTNTSDFTGIIFTTLMNPDEQAPESDPWTYLVNYQPDDENSVDIQTADELIRQLGADGLAADGTVYSTLDFPTDEEVFDKIIASGRTVYCDGAAIDPAELTPENYSIRWYVCKYQGDGWHIDGKLIPNVRLVAVTKTFAGEEAALAAIPEDFRILVTNNDSNDTMTLTMTDRTENQSNYGLISGEYASGSYGYISKSGLTYTWVLPVQDDSSFSITEENYDISADGVTYGISAQYSITNTDSEEEAAPMQQWIGTVSAYSKSYVASDVSLPDMKTTNLYNTYVETGTFVIQKRDTNTFAPMPDVQYRVYEVTDEGDRLLTLSKKEGSGNDGRYTVLYENGTTSDIAVTAADGNIYLKLPQPEDEGDTEQYTYRIEEIVPDGYREREDGRNPSFVVSVDKDGLFTIDDAETVTPAEGAIDPISIGTPGSAEEAAVTGVTMTNDPIRLIETTVKKTWDGSSEDSVTVKITGTADGNELVHETVTVTADEGWTYSLTDKLPLVSGNRLISYEISEVKIGSYDAGSDAFNNWTPHYLVPVYKDEDGNVLATEGTSVAAGDAYKVRYIEFTVLNEENILNSVTLDLVTTDTEEEPTVLNGAVYEIYEADPQSESTITVDGEEISVTDKGYVTDESGQLKLRYNRDYYLKEITSPEGYVPYDGYIHIRVTADGEIELVTESDRLSLETESGSLTGTLTVQNEPEVIIIIPTSVHTGHSPLLLLGAGMIIGLLILLKRRKQA